MDILKVRSFVKDLIYNLDTVQYLLDYGRVKETVPIIDSVLDDIDSFRAGGTEGPLKNIFPTSFWDKKLPAGMSYPQFRGLIKQYSQAKSPLFEEDLNKINYIILVKNISDWSHKNIPELLDKAKSPLHKKAERGILYSIVIITGLSLVIIAGWKYCTRDWGLKGSFFQGENFEKYLFSGVKGTIDFSEPEEMDSRLPHDHFSVQWQGDLLVPRSGEYTIFVSSDDGNRLIIDNKPLFADWSGHEKRESSKKIFLSQGPHIITLEYYQIDQSASLRLSWAMDGGKKEIIPAMYLRH